MREERIALLKKYMDEEPHNPFNIYALAMEYYEQEPTESLTLLQQLQTEHKEYLPTYFKLAHLYWDYERWDDADEVFTYGIKLAEKQEDHKALSELRSAYQNFQFERS